MLSERVGTRGPIIDIPRNVVQVVIAIGGMRGLGWVWPGVWVVAVWGIAVSIHFWLLGSTPRSQTVGLKEDGVLRVVPRTGTPYKGAGSPQPPTLTQVDL